MRQFNHAPDLVEHENIIQQSPSGLSWAGAWTTIALPVTSSPRSTWHPASVQLYQTERIYLSMAFTTPMAAAMLSTSLTHHSLEEVEDYRHPEHLP